MTTDRMFSYGVHKALQAHSGIAPTYSYLYSYKGRNSIGGVIGIDPKSLGNSLQNIKDTY